MIYPYFGTNHSNKVDLVDSTQSLLERMKNSNYDFIIITGKYKQITERGIVSKGYQKEKCNFAGIYVRNQKNVFNY